LVLVEVVVLIQTLALMGMIRYLVLLPPQKAVGVLVKMVLLMLAVLVVVVLVRKLLVALEQPIKVLRVEMR
jgi:hypothetical protein